MKRIIGLFVLLIGITSFSYTQPLTPTVLKTDTDTFGCFKLKSLKDILILVKQGEECDTKLQVIEGDKATLLKIVEKKDSTISAMAKEINYLERVNDINSGIIKNDSTIISNQKAIIKKHKVQKVPLIIGNVVQFGLQILWIYLLINK